MRHRVGAASPCARPFLKLSQKMASSLLMKPGCSCLGMRQLVPGKVTPTKPMPKATAFVTLKCLASARQRTSVKELRKHGVGKASMDDKGSVDMVAKVS